MDDVDELEVRLQLLHHALENALGAGPVDLDLDARGGRLEELRDLLRAGEGQGRVPDDLASFFATSTRASCANAGKAESTRIDASRPTRARHVFMIGLLTG